MDLRALQARFRGRGRDALARRLGVDARALAAVRISLGCLLLADLLLRSRSLVAFYTDAGVLPRAVLREQFGGLHHLSLHTISGEAWVQVVLFAVAAGFAAALALGYRTTTATVVSWVLLVSLHARNPVVLNAGDSILRRLLFWSVFLPLGGRWSLDALRASESGSAAQRAVRRAARIGSDDVGDADGTDDADRADGAADDESSGNVTRIPRRVASVASAALLIQVVLVYTVNALFKLRGDRWAGGEGLAYALSLDQLTVRLGDVLVEYPALLAVLDRLWLGLLVFSVLLVLLTGRARTLLVSLFVAMHVGMALTMRLGVFPLVSIVGLLPFLPSSVWDAATSAAKRGARRFGASRSRWRDRLVRVERGLSGSGAPKPTSRVARWKRRLGPPVVAGLLALVLVWNAATLGYVALPDGATSVADPGEYRWDMFAPDPRDTDGWYVVPGELDSGNRTDAFHGSSVRWDRPPDAARTYPDVRWFKYLVDLRRPDHAELREHFAAYLCQRWSERHDSELVRLTVYYVEQPTRLDGPEPIRPVELYRHECGSGGS